MAVHQQHASTVALGLQKTGMCRSSSPSRKTTYTAALAGWSILRCRRQVRYSCGFGTSFPYWREDAVHFAASRIQTRSADKVRARSSYTPTTLASTSLRWRTLVHNASEPTAGAADRAVFACTYNANSGRTTVAAIVSAST
eukprot:m.33025 g.33025  ORF g.33025 m.33025 type:complete len:141 (+) comp14189_c0_seq2:114-536(+)